ncbi:MAG: response regulator [Candidatus Binatia bacterium]
MGLKVLVVDDEEDIVEVIQDRLEAYGFTVVSARTGVEALEKLSLGKFDGILLDIRMPEMDGLKVLERIRATDKKIPVIIITAFSNKDAALEALFKEANDYILKPFEWEELKAKIERVCNITL